MFHENNIDEKEKKREELNALLERYCYEKKGDTPIFSCMDDRALEKWMEKNLSHFEFTRWLAQLNQSNINFARIIKAEGFVTDGSVLEINSSKEYTVQSKLCLPVVKNLAIKSYGGSGLFLHKNVPYNGEHIIVNGLYSDVPAYMSASALQGGFTVGMYSHLDNKMWEVMLKYYRAILKEIQEQQNLEQKVQIFEGISQERQEQVYILHYQNQPKKNAPEIPAVYKYDLDALSLSQR